MVTVVLQGPLWFYGIDGILEGVAALVSLLVCLLSWKAWKLVRIKRYYFFSISFALMTIAMATRALTNYLVHSGQYPEYMIWGYGVHIALTLLGLITLLTLSLVIRQRRMFILFFLLIFGTLLFSKTYYISFYYLSFILFGTIAYHFYENWLKKKTTLSWLAMASFSLLTLAQLMFGLTAYMNGLFIPAHTAQILGYAGLFFTLMKVILK